MSLRICALALAFAAYGSAAAISAEAAVGQASGGWATRTQVLYQPDTRSVVRRSVRVWDMEPSKNLEFVWEPGTGASIAPDGSIEGSGKLVWRVRGSASYDKRTIYSTYVGEMKDGRLNGRGRLELRGGETFEGQFVDGVLNGPGTHVSSSGDRYEGEFVAGKPNGRGRLALATGEIFTGSFVHGLKHGEGETRLPGGAVYTSLWTMGRESGRPAVLADATIGGLLRTQAGGGDAGKLEIAVAMEPRLTQQTQDEGGVAYQSLVRDGDIAIFPVDQPLNDLWNGAGEINPRSAWALLDRDWEYVPAFVEVKVKTKDGSRVKVDKLEMQVAASEAYRKPMLDLVQHVGCVGFRPSFSIRNFGWGEATDMKLNLHFRGENTGQTSRSFTRTIGSFDQGIDVAVKDILDEAGVDTGKLETKRFTCQSRDALNVCRSQVFNDVGFGEVADFVWGEDKLYTTAAGSFDYSWSDDAGNIHAASEPFSVDISLTLIEVPNEAECGAGFGASPEALRYQDVRFRVGEKDYAIDMPIRGNKRIANYSARLKMSAEPAMSSYHQFSVQAHLGDGSVKTSKPVSFFFFRPRIPEFTPGMEPAACYLAEGTYGC